MTEKPWIIDTWVNLLRPVPEHQRAAAENVFGRYDQLDVVREGTKPKEIRRKFLRENAIRAFRLEG